MKALLENWRTHLDEELEDFDKSSLEVKNSLNPDIWDGKRLHPEIRERLLRIAFDFFEGLRLGDVTVYDIVFTGSLANYNWSSYSDVDLHIIIDFREVNEDVELVRSFLNAKKGNWNRIHDIRIKGFEAEVYVENVADTHISSGVYSIVQDKWLMLPPREKPEISWEDIAVKAEAIIAEIEEVEAMYSEGYYEEAIVNADRLKDKIKKFRKAGLESGGEYSIENLAFKVLRRTDYIGRLMRVKNDAYDKALSINGF